MIDLGNILYYIGIEVDYILKNKITFYQSTYLKKVLNCFNIVNSKFASFFIN